MSNIQQAINQAMGTVAVAARLSPDYETKQELYKLGKEEEVINKQGEAAKLLGKEAKDPDLIRSIGDISQRSMELAKKKFQLNPTEENFQDAVQKQQSYRAFNKYEELMMRQQEAIDKASGIGEAKKQLKRNFMEYLRLQPIAGGGTVGQLSPKAQKQIASQYSKSERKKLMDEEDKR